MRDQKRCWFTAQLMNTVTPSLPVCLPVNCLTDVGAMGNTRTVIDQGLQARVRAASDGCYEAVRASALAGVPLSTLHWWARQEIVVPSVSPVREKLWSYADLMTLRVVAWLRHRKPDAMPASPMPKVRRALRVLAELDLSVWDTASAVSPFAVDASGEVFVRDGDRVFDSAGHPTLLPEESLDLTAPFSTAGLLGPDLIAPRAHLRIVPAKVSGEPHLEGSRITTVTLAALADRGFGVKQIANLYEVPELQVGEAIELEAQLEQSTRIAA